MRWGTCPAAGRRRGGGLRWVGDASVVGEESAAGVRRRADLAAALGGLSGLIHSSLLGAPRDGMDELNPNCASRASNSAPCQARWRPHSISRPLGCS